MKNMPLKYGRAQGNPDKIKVASSMTKWVGGEREDCPSSYKADSVGKKNRKNTVKWMTA